jgi:hypothetical protein
MGNKNLRFWQIQQCTYFLFSVNLLLVGVNYGQRTMQVSEVYSSLILLLLLFNKVLTLLNNLIKKKTAGTR